MLCLVVFSSAESFFSSACTHPCHGVRTISGDRAVRPGRSWSASLIRSGPKAVELNKRKAQRELSENTAYFCSRLSLFCCHQLNRIKCLLKFTCEGLEARVARSPPGFILVTHGQVCVVVTPGSVPFLCSSVWDLRSTMQKVTSFTKRERRRTCQTRGQMQTGLQGTLVALTQIIRAPGLIPATGDVELTRGHPTPALLWAPAVWFCCWKHSSFS